uniref:Vesicle-fusing ATPase n=1 Tax=Chrysotila carterae TaxID=13221 RepID=A0A7S4BN56_CHRCT
MRRSSAADGTSPRSWASLFSFARNQLPPNTAPISSVSHSPLDAPLRVLHSAADADEAGRYEEALHTYERGVQGLLDAIKLEHSEERKQQARRHAEACLARAEALKAKIGGRGGGRGGAAASSRGRGVLPLPPRAERGRGVPAGMALGAGRGCSRPGAPPAHPTRTAPEAAAASQSHGAVVHEKPNVHWDDVAGLDDAKAALQEAVVLPLRFPQLFTGERKPWRGILLYGPPGTGKTHLAKAVATEVDATFFSISSSDLVSKWVGESEKQVRTLFEAAEAMSPSIIFIDEVDALTSTRSDDESDASRRLKNELLVRMSNVKEKVLVLGATNVPWSLDPAVRRRFERRIYLPLPETPAREAMLKIHLGRTPHTLSASQLAAIARKTEGMSGADISILVRDALMQPLRELQAATHFKRRADGMLEPCRAGERGAVAMTIMQVPPDQLYTPVVSQAHFEAALRSTRPSLSRQDLKRYDEFQKEFGSG